MSKEETAVRDAANTLYGAIQNARAAGLRVDWPARLEELPQIAVSETSRTAATVTVTGDVDPAVADKAATAAQKVIDKAAAEPAAPAA